MAEGVITIWIPSVREQAGESLSAHYHAVLNEVREVPFVRAAALTTVLPLGPVEATTTVAPESDHIERNSAQPVQYRAVSPSYFSVMGISLLRGRDFNDGDTAGAPGVAILNDVAARRYWPGVDPIGKRLATGFTDGRPGWAVVIGVVGGVRQSNLATEPGKSYTGPTRRTSSLITAQCWLLRRKATRAWQFPRFERRCGLKRSTTLWPICN